MQTTIINAESALADVIAANGRSYAHVVTSVREIEEIAEHAEARLDALMLPQALRLGARVVFVGASPGASSYGHRVTVSKLELVRRKAGWDLVNATTAFAYPKSKAVREMRLTERQIDESRRRIVAAAFADVKPIRPAATAQAA